MDEFLKGIQANLKTKIVRKGAKSEVLYLPGEGRCAGAIKSLVPEKAVEWYCRECLKRCKRAYEIKCEDSSFSVSTTCQSCHVFTLFASCSPP